MISNWSYSPETHNLGQNRRFFEPCDLDIWRMTFQNNRAPLLCQFKLCAAFRSHWWFQTGVTVRKRLHDVYNARMAETYLATAIYVWPAVVDTLAPGQDLILLQRLHVFAHSRDPHPAIKFWCQVPFTKSKTIFQIEMYCMQCFLKSKYIKSRTFNDNNRWIIKKVIVLKKLLPHLATRGTYPPGV